MTLNTQIDRAHCRPWGLEGGRDGTGNEVSLRLGDQWKTDFPNAKVLVADLEPGDAFRLRSGGGGGYGSPLERPVDLVANDVKQGYVSVEAAAELYGVVIDPVSFDIDLHATERLRVTGSPRPPAGAAMVELSALDPSPP
jgi:N-methylhydantoinase B